MNRTVSPLTCAGLALLGAYVLLWFLHQEPRWIRASAIRDFGHFLIVAVLAAGFCRSLAATPDRRTILGFAVLFIAANLFIEPFHSLDVYCYINSGHLQHHYGANPYSRVPGLIPGADDDPMITRYWRGTNAAYGFAFTLLTRAVASVGSLPLAVLLFKLLNAAVLAATAAVAARLAQRLGTMNPDRARLLILWNPLLLVQMIGNAHNDLLLGFLTLLALAAAITGRGVLVIPLLMLAMLIKIVTVFLLPLAFLYVVKVHSWRTAVAGTIAAMILGAICFVPFLTPDSTPADFLRIVSNTSELHNSLAALADFPLELFEKLVPWVRHNHAILQKVITTTFWLGFLSVFVVVAGSRLRMRGYPLRTFLSDALLIQLLVVCVVSPKYYSWYLGMVFPLIVLVPSSDWRHRALLAFSVAQLLALTPVGQVHGLNVVLMTLLPLAWARGWFDRRQAPSRIPHNSAILTVAHPPA